MSFETDKQTLEDLNLLGRYKNNSVYNLFAGTVSRGGERLLEELFLHPLTAAGPINERTEIFRYFSKGEFVFPVEAGEFEQVEQYLSSLGGQSVWGKMWLLCRSKAMEWISNDIRLELWKEQISLTLNFLRKIRAFLEQLEGNMTGNPLEKQVKTALSLLRGKVLSSLLDSRKEKLNIREVFVFDRVLGGKLNEELMLLLKLFHWIDVALVVGRVVREQKFCFAEAVAEGETTVSVSVQGLFHPCLVGAIANDVEITPEKNIFFLTGANMAGKSTLMKSLGIAVYLAHAGMPVAARNMHFRVQDGLYTSINVADNIQLGYSHFYSEVLRVKKVALEINKGKRLVVIFDELFKGTNVKDAYDATFAVTHALTHRWKCSVMVSTHITEVGLELKKCCPQVTFAYLPTVMRDKLPTYTYRLEPGITDDKQGMFILENEHIVDLIKEAASGPGRV